MRLRDEIVVITGTSDGQGRSGIRVNTLSPGIIDTPAVAPILGAGADPDARALDASLSKGLRY